MGGGPPPAPIVVAAPADRGLADFQVLFDYDCPGEYFGRGCDADGDALAVSGTVGDPEGTFSADAYVYRRAATGRYELEQVIPIPEDTGEIARSDYWGLPIAIQGDVLAVADSYGTAHGQQGLVDVFRRVGGVWALDQTLYTEDGCYFGVGMTFRHGLLLINNSEVGVGEVGAVEVWEEETPGTLSRTAQISGPYGQQWFGDAIHCASPTRFFASTYRPGGDAGAVHEVVKVDGSWEIVEDFEAEEYDYTFATGIWFSPGETSDGDVLICSCPEHYHPGRDDVGCVHLLRRGGDGWEESAQLELPEPLRVAFASFGRLAAVTEEGFLVVGGRFGLHVFRSAADPTYVLRLSLGESTYSTLIPPWQGVQHFGDTSLCPLPGGGVAYGISANEDLRSAFYLAAVEAARNTAELRAAGTERLGAMQGMDADGEFLVAKSNGDGGEDGSVRTWRRAGLSMTYEGRLSAPAPYSGYGFGLAVRISGNTLLTCSPFADQGTALVFVRNLAGDGWELQQAIPNTIPTRYLLGFTLALDGDTLALVAGSGGISGDAEVRVYARSGGVWTPQQVIPFDQVDPADQLNPVALEGDVLAIGVPNFDAVAPSREGQVLIYRRSAGVWSLSQTITGPDLGFGSYQLFGRSVALDGGVLVVGAPGFDGESYAAPAVLVFEEEGGQFAEVARFAGNHRYLDAYAEHLGYHVAKRGDVIVASDHGYAARFYSYNGLPREAVGAALLILREDGDWVAKGMLQPSSLNGNFTHYEALGGAYPGNAVATDGRSIFLSAPGRNSIHQFDLDQGAPGPWPGCFCSAYGQSMYGPCSPYGYCQKGGGVGPIVVKIETPDLRTLIVTFEREMLDNADLVNPRAYVLTGGARVVSAVRLNATQVRLRTSRKLRNRRAYQLTVLANPGS